MDVALFGSGTARRSFGPEGAEPVRIIEHFGGSSFASAFTPPGWLDLYSRKLDAPEQRRRVADDLNKAFQSRLPTLPFDILIVDFSDERFHLCRQRNGGIVTLSDELIAAGFDPETSGGRTVRSGSEEFLDCWLAGWAAFIETLKKAGKLERLYLNKAGMENREATHASQFLDHLHAHAARDIPACRILPSEPAGGSRPVQRAAAGADALTSQPAINLITPNSLYGARFNQLDLSVNKSIPVGWGRVRVAFDLYNALNANSIQNVTTTYGPTWLRPTTFLDPRLARVTASLSF